MRRRFEGYGERERPKEGDSWTHKETGKMYRWSAEREMWVWTGEKKVFNSPMETRRHGLASKDEEA